MITRNAGASGAIANESVVIVMESLALPAGTAGWISLTSWM
jgi:hypothetical protein